MILRDRLLGRILSGLLVVACVSPAPAQSTATAPAKLVDELAPLPQDDGHAGLELMFKRLKTTARLLQTTAHPDDEDGGLLTLQSRGHGVDVTLMTLTHGEGGQNKTGSNLFDELGVLRVLELLESDKYYGVHQRFSLAADFGFSKSPQESLDKWKGSGSKPGYIPLRDMVRVIRTFRPDVIAQRFQGSDRDGHGHHQASGILTKEAFRAAADSRQFPELHLPAWQAKKLYMGLVRDGEDYSVAFDTGANDPALDGSYVQFAMKGLKHQLSQGAGSWHLEPGPHMTYYKLIDSAASVTTQSKEHEKDFFDGIDTSLPGLAKRLGNDLSKLPHLEQQLTEVAQAIDKASQAKAPEEIAAPLSQAISLLRTAKTTVQSAELPAVAKDDLLSRLDEKIDQASTAEKLALGLKVYAVTNETSGAQAFATPGQRVPILLHFSAESHANVRLTNITGLLPTSRFRETNVPDEAHSGSKAASIAVPSVITRPGFHRDNPERDSVYQSDDPDPTIPFSAGAPRITVAYQGGSGANQYAGRIEVPIEVELKQLDGTTRRRPLAIAPKFSVLIDPATQIVPTDARGAREIRVNVRSIAEGNAKGTLRLALPQGWKAEPASQELSFEKYGEERTAKFQVTPIELREREVRIQAAFESEGKSYTEGYTTVMREDLGTYYYYQPSVQKVSEVKVATEPKLKVGYIMGAGDDIPTVLEQIGIDVSVLKPEELASGDLSHYGTIVLGIRAYDTRDDIKKYNQRLLDYTKNGGTLIVQYNAGVADFNDGKFMPYPATLTRDRVSVEDAPVQVLEPQNPIFHYPNQIAAADFNGWVQERGLYFAEDMDPQYHALLSCHDPKEPERKGGMLEAKYGKGTYVYTGYAFFRQLPVGVPGAVRLFVNLLSAGHESH